MLGKIGHLIVAMLVSAFIFSVFVVISGVNTGTRATTVDMVYGQSDKPYVYRALLPITARIITEVTPKSVRSNVNKSLAKTEFVQSIPEIYDVDRDHLYEIFIVLILMYLSLLGFVYSLRYLTKGVFKISQKKTNIISLVAVLLIVQAFVFGYIYDFAALFLMTLSYGLLARQRHIAYLVLFPFVCLNKETSILLVFVYWVHFQTTDNKRLFYTYLSYQIGVFVIIKLALYWAFRDNIGDSLEFHLPEHFIEYHRILTNYPILVLYYCLFLFGIPALMFYRWDEKPLFLKNCVLVIGPLFFLYILFGYPFEVRVFYEVYPIVLLLMVHSLGTWFGINVQEPSWSTTPVVSA